MERPFDDAATLHLIRDSMFRTDSPLHHNFSISLERFIAERTASRESESFPCLSRDLHSCSQKLADTQAKVIELEQRIDALQTTAASATAATDHRVDTLQSLTENATQAAVSELRRVEHELSQCYALLNEFVRASSQPRSNNFQFPQPQPQLQPQPPSPSNQPLYAPPSSSPHPPQQPPPQPPVFDPHPAHQFAVERAPMQEILGRRVERLNKLVKKFSGRHGSGEFRTWKEDLLRAFILSDITSPVDQVTTISFLLEGDAAEYYHSLTKAVQDDWFELMRVLGQRFDCISHEPVYLSRMLSLKESEFPRHADYVREIRTCVIKSKVNTSDLQMGYLVNSRFVEGLSNDAVRRQYIVEVRSRWRSNRPFGFDTLVETIAEAYIAAGYQLEEVQNASRTTSDTLGPAVSRPLPMMVPPILTSLFPSNPMPTPHVNPMPTPAAAPMGSTVPEPMNLDAIAKLQEELHAYIGERRNERFGHQDGGRQDGGESRCRYNCCEQGTRPVTVQRIDRHPEDESVENQGQTRRDEITVEIARGGFDPAPRADKGPQRPRKHFRRPGGGRPREELNTTTSTNKPDKHATFGGVDVEGTETEHASLFTVRGRICACREDSFDSSVELFVDCGATSDFMSMQTAKRARLPLYKLRNPGHVLTAGGVQVEVRYYTRAHV